MKLTKHYHKHYMYSCLSDTVAVVFYIFLKITPKNENLFIFSKIYEAILYSNKKYWLT